MKLVDIITERKKFRGNNARPGFQKMKPFGRGARKEALKRKDEKHNRWKKGLVASRNLRSEKLKAQQNKETKSALEQQ